MDQKYLTDSESLSLNIEATCLLLSFPRNFQYEIKTDKYNPYPSMISMFTSDSQHPPKSRHAVHLGGEGDTPSHAHPLRTLNLSSGTPLEDTGESAHLHRLTLAFVTVQNLLCCLKWRFVCYSRQQRILW